MELVSIIIPCYNGAQYAWQCIDSCISQSYKNIEIIVVNDGSTDDSVKIINSRTDNRLRIIHNDGNHGTAFARNRGIENSQGSIIAFLDIDDMLTYDSIERRIKFIQLGFDIVYGACYRIEGDRGLKYYAARHDQLRIKNSKIVASPTGMIRKAIIDKYGYFREDVILNEDREFWTRMLVVHKIMAVKMAQPLAYYRVHGDSKMRKASQEERSEASKYVNNIVGGIEGLEITEFISLVNIKKWS